MTRRTCAVLLASVAILVVMKIGDLKQGRSSGRIFNPGSPCKGKIIYKGRKGPKYLFRYREVTNTSDCTGDDKITVSLSGGQLMWKGVSPAGIVGKARLDRV